MAQLGSARVRPLLPSPAKQHRLAMSLVESTTKVEYEEEMCDLLQRGTMTRAQARANINAARFILGEPQIDDN